MMKTKSNTCVSSAATPVISVVVSSLFVILLASASWFVLLFNVGRRLGSTFKTSSLSTSNIAIGHIIRPNDTYMKQQQQHSRSTTTTTTTTSSTTRKKKVFGLGYSETGTLSMAKALTILGYTRTIHTDTTLASFMHHDIDSANMTGRYDHIDSVWDVPTAAYYEALLDAYPDSKFILTIQHDSNTWYDAVERAIYSTKWQCNVPVRIQRMNKHLLYGTAFPDRQRWIHSYEEHNQNVISFFARRAPTQLLVIDHSTIIEDDDEDESFISKNQKLWSQICPFVGITDGPCANQKLSFVSKGIMGLFGQNNNNVAISSTQSSSASKTQLPIIHVSNCTEKVHLESTLMNQQKQRKKKVVVSDNDDGQQEPGDNNIANITMEKKKIKELAYVVLICNPAHEDQTGYFRMLLVLKESIYLYEDKDEVDVVVMIYGTIRDDQLYVLQYEGFVVKLIDTVASETTNPPNPAAAERSIDVTNCYRSKIRILELIEYEYIIFLDTDMLVKRSLRDTVDYVKYNASIFVYDGPGSPLCAAIMTLSPSKQVFADIVDIMESDSFHPSTGWCEYGKFPYWKRTHGLVEWSFWGATWEQGTLYYYYDKVLNDALILSTVAYDHGVLHYGGHDSKPYLYDPNNITKSPQGIGRIELWYQMWYAIEERLNKANDPIINNTLTFLNSVNWY